jgi:hyperosmotically inducible protein
MKNRLLGILLFAASASAATVSNRVYSDSEIAAKVAHEIRMYPRYTIWDNVNLQVRDGNVELLGQVSQPFKKKDMERLAQSVQGVTGVTNQLEVLPASFFDDELRIRVARAIYSDPALSRYAIQAVPPIHVIVDRGHVSLEGVVNSELEKTVAGMRASTAGLSLGAVTNNLRVENRSSRG